MVEEVDLLEQMAATVVQMAESLEETADFVERLLANTAFLLTFLV